MGKMNSLLAISYKMLELAKAENWLEIGELEDQRQTMMFEAFNSPIDPAVASGVAVDIQRILEINSEIEQFASLQRSQVSSQLKELRHGQKATSIYNDIEQK